MEHSQSGASPDRHSRQMLGCSALTVKTGAASDEVLGLSTGANGGGGGSRKVEGMSGASVTASPSVTHLDNSQRKSGNNSMHNSVLLSDGNRQAQYATCRYSLLYECVVK